MVNEGATHPRGEALYEELLFIHGMIRQSLDTVSVLVDQVTGGAPAEQIRASVDKLASTSLLWRLRESCMQYCYFVHLHHNHEDTHWFPALRGVNPELHPVIDRLEADHRLVSEHLDAVETAARRVDDDEPSRADLADGLRRLAEHLTSHLDYEETNLGPTLRRIRSWSLDRR
ncbi:MAG: hemerythrin domain-containing protein [Actinomycetota bacterium]|jgi:iron-sulfur cluster repair protein YtfE (RIC family)|nr:hemerythrin domain-containing protein [Actinomycetota bacterium]